MTRRATRLTRAEKVALSGLCDRYRSARELQVSASALDSLSARGLCDLSLDVGTPIYRINENGLQAREKFASQVTA